MSMERHLKELDGEVEAAPGQLFSLAEPLAMGCAAVIVYGGIFLMAVGLTLAVVIVAIGNAKHL